MRAAVAAVTELSRRSPKEPKSPCVNTWMVEILPEYGTKVGTLFVLECGVGVFVRNQHGGNPNPVVTSRRQHHLSRK